MKKGERFTFQQLKEDMKTMSFGKKIEHIWLNFKEYIIVGTILLTMIVMLLVSISGNQKEVLISGYLLNLDPSGEGLHYISDGYFEAMGGNENTQQQILTTGRYVTEGTNQQIDISYNNYVRVLSLVASESLDYVMADELAISVFIKDEIFADLREFYTEEELQAWEGKLLYAQPEGGERYPIAFDLGGTEFARECLSEGSECFLAFTAHAARKEACRNFFDYLLAYPVNE